MSVFTTRSPSRWVIFCSVFAIAFAVFAVLYKKLEGEGEVSSGAGFIAVAMGIFVVTFFSIDRRRRYQSLTAENDFGPLPRNARRASWIGAAIVIGSLIYFAVAVAILGLSAHQNLILYTWLAVFLIGFAFLVYPTIIRWAITYGVISPRD
ncbi:MAG TPA: hypothetical protein VGK90_03125 [Rhizomicrobium sp.]